MFYVDVTIHEPASLPESLSMTRIQCFMVQNYNRLSNLTLSCPYKYDMSIILLQHSLAGTNVRGCWLSLDVGAAGAGVTSFRSNLALLTAQHNSIAQPTERELAGAGFRMDPAGN